MNTDYIKPWSSPLYPFKDELFSSWIARMALSYHISPRELFSKHFAKYQIYRRDVDITRFDTDFWKKLSHLTQLPSKKIECLQLLNLEGKIQEKINATQRNRWIIPSSGDTYCKTYKSKGLRFCPLCLKEKGYYSKDSKLLFINACTQHKVYLHSHCPQCDSPILPIRISPPKTISQCFNCGFDLSDTITDNTSSFELEAIRYSKKVLSRNYFVQMGVARNAMDYFTVLYLLTKNLHRFFPEDKIYAMYKIVSKRANQMSPYILGQSPQYLSQLVAIANSLLLDEWNGELKEFLSRNKLIYTSKLLNKRENVNYAIPYWFNQYLKSLWLSKKKENI